MDTSTPFLAAAATRMLEGVFVFGILGSALVIIFAGIEDLREVLKRDMPGQEETE